MTELKSEQPDFQGCHHQSTKFEEEGYEMEKYEVSRSVERKEADMDRPDDGRIKCNPAHVLPTQSLAFCQRTEAEIVYSKCWATDWKGKNDFDG
jgi:hypothetical protein